MAAGRQRKADIVSLLGGHESRDGLLAAPGLLAVTVSERGSAQMYPHAPVDDVIAFCTASVAAGAAGAADSGLHPAPKSPKTLRLAGVASYVSTMSDNPYRPPLKRPLRLYTTAFHVLSEAQNRLAAEVLPRGLGAAAATAAASASADATANTAPEASAPAADATPSAQHQARRKKPAPEVEFWDEWTLYWSFNHSDKVNALARANEVLADTFAAYLRDACAGAASKRANPANPANIVLVLDSKLAPVTRALLKHKCAAQIHTCIQDDLDCAVAKAILGPAHQAHPQGAALRCCQLFDFLNDTQTLSNPGSNVSACGVWLDHAAIQRPQTIAELMVCDGWGNLNRLFESGVLGDQLPAQRQAKKARTDAGSCASGGNGSADGAGTHDALAGARTGAHGQYFGIYYKHAPSKLVWDGAGIDFVCFGVQKAARQHCPHLSVTPVYVATFSLPPAPRVAIIFHINATKGPPAQDGVRVSSANTRPAASSATTAADPPRAHRKLPTPENAPCHTWHAWSHWDLGRPKVATTASSKFERISVQLARIAKAFKLQTLVLVEPGFHHVLSAVLEQTPVKHVTCFVENDEPLQRAEVVRRFGGQTRVTLASMEELAGCKGQGEPPAVVSQADGTASGGAGSANTAHALDCSAGAKAAGACDGLVLLMDGGAAAWRKLWFTVVEAWLEQTAAKFKTAPNSAAVLSVMFESSSAIAQAVFDDVQLCGQALGLHVSCDASHEIFSLSHRYAFQNFRFAPADLGSVEWPVLVYPELKKKKKNKAAHK